MLQVRNLTFERGGHRLFSDVNLVVYPGQKVAIVGRNGVGKSTFFDLLMGRLEASQGISPIPKTGWGYGARGRSNRAAGYRICYRRSLRPTRGAGKNCLGTKS